MKLTGAQVQFENAQLIADGRTACLLKGRFVDVQRIPSSIRVSIHGIEAVVLGPNISIGDNAETYIGFVAEFILPPRSGTQVDVKTDTTWASGERDVSISRQKISSPPSRGPTSRSVTSSEIESVQRVAIVMATYNPKLEFLQRQIESIKAQTYEDWICIIQDDASSVDEYESIVAAVAGDSRFQLEVCHENQGFYRNFELALLRVPRAAEFVVFCDQDDWWNPEKLATLVSTLRGDPELQLLYSDLRIVDAGGEELSNTFHAGRASRRDLPDSVLIANVVTGCSTMFRGSLLDVALPFPRAGRSAYHDHWLAYCASGVGGVGYVPIPLTDYVQHDSNTLGARGSDVVRLARMFCFLVSVPLLTMAATVPALRRRLRGILGIVLNQSTDEYAMRRAFATTLSLRVDHPTHTLSIPNERRVMWMGRRMVIGATYGIGHSVVAMRLFAAFLVEAGIRGVRRR